MKTETETPTETAPVTEPAKAPPAPRATVAAFLPLALRHLAEVAASEPGRFPLHAIQLRLSPDGVTATATDGRRLVSVTAPATRVVDGDGPAPDATILLPAEAFADWAKRCKVKGRGRHVSELERCFRLEVREDGELELSHAATGQSLRLRPIEGRFPDWQSCVPHRREETLTLAGTLKGMKPDCAVVLDPVLLAGTASALLGVTRSDDRDLRGVAFFPNGQRGAVLMTSSGDVGTGVGVLMPIAADASAGDEEKVDWPTNPVRKPEPAPEPTDPDTDAPGRCPDALDSDAPEAPIHEETPAPAAPVPESVPAAA